MTNSVFQFIKERGKPPNDPSEPKGSFYYGNTTLPNSSYAYDVIRDESILLFCDTNIFSGTNLPMVREVLRRNHVLVVPPVVDELWNYATLPPRTPADAEVTNLLFSDRTLNPTLKIVRPTRYRDIQPALNYYITLLLQRKAIKQYLIEGFERQNGRPPTNAERTRFSQMLAGISKSTSKMANKGGRYELAADEALVVIAMFEAVWLRKNIAILSFDNDVFIQFFKIISLMAEDYLSHLIASDYQTQPERYSKRYDLAMYHDFDTMISDKSKSFAITKPRDVVTLFPPSENEPTVTMLKPTEQPEIMWTQCLSGYEKFLEIKSRARGRNTDRPDGLNCYAQLIPTRTPPQLPQHLPLALFIDDRLLVDEANAGFRISEADLLRSLADVEKPIVDFRGHAFVWRDS